MTLFASLITRMGLSQPDAAILLDARPDSVKSWYYGRRSVPAGVIDELVSLNQAIVSEAQAALQEWREAGEPELWAYEYAGEKPYPRWGDMVMAELKCLLPIGTALEAD